VVIDLNIPKMATESETLNMKLGINSLSPPAVAAEFPTKDISASIAVHCLHISPSD